MALLEIMSSKHVVHDVYTGHISCKLNGKHQ
jgi:hypothetical protein